mmetsp:Transcript_42324/g.70643  ORF Transcript_42324/g.70643 Transcript_42324/m.70643 type:complete len:249 (-) Transcript_42324:212-958(-)
MSLACGRGIVREFFIPSCSHTVRRDRAIRFLLHFFLVAGDRDLLIHHLPVITSLLRLATLHTTKHDASSHHKRRQYEDNQHPQLDIIRRVDAALVIIVVIVVIVFLRHRRRDRRGSRCGRGCDGRGRTELCVVDLILEVFQEVLPVVIHVVLVDVVDIFGLALRRFLQRLLDGREHGRLELDRGVVLHLGLLEQSARAGRYILIAFAHVIDQILERVEHVLARVAEIIVVDVVQVFKLILHRVRERFH